MLEEVTVRTEIETKNDKLQSVCVATSVDNLLAPEGINIRQKVNGCLQFLLSADLKKGNVSVWKIKNTITDFIFHLRISLRVLNVLSKFKER